MVNVKDETYASSYKLLELCKISLVRFHELYWLWMISLGSQSLTPLSELLLVYRSLV